MSAIADTRESSVVVQVLFALHNNFDTVGPPTLLPPDKADVART